MIFFRLKKNVPLVPIKARFTRKFRLLPITLGQPEHFSNRCEHLGIVEEYVVRESSLHVKELSSILGGAK